METKQTETDMRACHKMRGQVLSSPRNSLDPHYLVPHYYLGRIPSLFGSRWVVGYQVVGVLRVPRILCPLAPLTFGTALLRATGALNLLVKNMVVRPLVSTVLYVFGGPPCHSVTGILAVYRDPPYTCRYAWWSCFDSSLRRDDVEATQASWAGIIAMSFAGTAGVL